MAGWLRRALALAAVVAALASCAPSAADLDRAFAEAQSELRRGRIDEALALAERGAERAQEAENDLAAWRFRLLAADARLTRLEFPAAMAILDIEPPSGPEFDPLRGRRLHLLARAKVAQGQLAAAQPLVAEAMPLAAGDPALLLDLELLQSQLLYRSGKAGDADALLAAARERVQREGDPYRLAQVSNNTGMGLVTRGRFDEALPYFDAVVDEPTLEGTTIQGSALNNAGLCRARLGQFDRAVELQQRAVKVQEGGRRQNYVQALGELGATYLLQDDLTRGSEYLQRAFTIAAESGLASDAALFARNLAATSVALGKWDDAERYNQEAARLAGVAAAPASPYTTVIEAQVAAGRGDRDVAARLFRQSLDATDVPPGVRWMALDGLARTAAAAGTVAEAEKYFEQALQTVEQTRSALLRADYRISFTSRLVQFYRGYVDFLLSRGQFERALIVADSSRARVLAERQSVTTPTRRTTTASLKQLSRASGSTLLFYWLGPEQSWAWVVTAEGVSATKLPPAGQIETLVAEHQSAIQSALADPMAASGSAGERLYEVLLRPVAALLTRPSLVIVPDGALHRLNFETLVVPGTGSRQTAGEVRSHYLIDDLTIQIAPSLAMLQRGGAAAPGRGSLLLVGNATARPPEFPGLTYAAAEMSGIRASFAPDAVSVVDGDRASPAAFRAAAPEKFSVIHFTSHAVANTESPLDSAVILSGPDQAYKLYARDVAALPLTADLVTVSACRSAGERAFAGEGLVGFAWAFLRAGSRRVVAGLWDVDDRSTAALMEDLYARMAAGTAPPAALREAKRRLMKDGYAKPYYWAPFQIFTVVL